MLQRDIAVLLLTAPPLPYSKSVWALYKGALPPALGWSLIDSVLLGSLHNYRLMLIRQGFTEKVVARTSKTGTSKVDRLTLTAHGVAGLCAGVTRCVHSIARRVHWDGD